MNQPAPEHPTRNLGRRAWDSTRTVFNGKILGILGLLIAIGLFTALNSEQFLTAGNIEKLVHRTALYGILGVGAAFVIITAGIDLSIGSMVCLVGVLLPFLLVKHAWPPWLGVVFVLALSAVIGIFHGLLVTKMRLQPFIVTLCGLLLYRGIARGVTNDQAQDFGVGFKGLRSIATERIPIFGDAPGVFQLPATTLAFIIISILAAIFLNKTIWGRYLLALGRNEQAARYSGINTGRMILLAYIICAALAGLGGMLFVLDINAAQPSDFGNFYELYAIAAAVLGGCSLRGGEGSILGVAIGAAIMVVLSNMINLVYPNYINIEFAIIGGVILAGVIVDELVKRVAARRRATSSAAAIEPEKTA
ncbi:MAG: ABC transporter permease [Phycisphaerae bacterium]|nr:ABC transporter permease [Phycisphaerae bacterium]